jgi:hypothetical protein
LNGKFRGGSSALYHRSRYFNPGDMLATVALLVCFAVVVQPSLFTIAPNRGSGSPSPSDGAPQAAVSAPVEMSQLTAMSAPVEMPQPAAVSALVEMPPPAAVSALVKTSQPIAFAHWLVSDLFRTGPAKEFELHPVQRGGLSELDPRNGPALDLVQVVAGEDGRETLPAGMIKRPTGDIPVQTPGQNVHVADGEGTTENLLTDDAINVSFVGIWAADARACSALDRSGFLLTVIDTDGARTGETLCAFKSKRQTKLGWDLVAKCSNSRERWTANVSLSVKDNRLSWKSQRGTQTYLRCQREEMMAQAQ